MANQREKFLLTPLREGRRCKARGLPGRVCDFYSRPCGRGDSKRIVYNNNPIISTHAPAGGATSGQPKGILAETDFYSRPCGRGDKKQNLTAS